VNAVTLEELESEAQIAPRLWPSEELAYLAGFLDGEGTFTVYSGETQGAIVYSALMSAGNNDKAVLAWIQQAFGGKVWCVGGKAHCETTYQWMIQEKSELIALIPQLLPYLKTKNLQARLVLKYCIEFQHARRGVVVTKEDHELRNAYCVMFKELNARGKGSTETKTNAIRLIVNSGILDL